MTTQFVRRLALRVARKVDSHLLPSSSRLPFRYRINLLLGECEKELRYLSRIVPTGGGIAIDAGANEGMFSYAMSKLFPKVYSFEINDDLTRDLSAYNPGNIEIIDKGLSSRQGNATLYIPIVNGHPLTGWASLAPGNCPGAQEHAEKPVEICPLDAFGIRSVAFIKIDVEGHEVEVLEGARETITSSRPYVLVEVKDKNVDPVNALFAELGYRKRSLHDLIGIEGSPENFIFVPDDKA